MFHKPRSRVKVNGKISKPINNRYDVMQGGVLSPNLVNEFLQYIRKYINTNLKIRIAKTKIVIYNIIYDKR